MFKADTAFSGISVKDLAVAKEFYTKTLGLEIEDETMGLDLRLPGGGKLFLYPKEDHQPATFTVLNFVVKSVDDAVKELASQGVEFEHYDNENMKTDEKGIARGKAQNMGPDIAWFKDPSGNTLAVLEN
jgi:catechol 2,3-dioxygenase-like lactoylglutathione lyase family enzyme